MSKRTKKPKVVKIETEEQAIQEWKKLGITSCTMTFSCGNDSMNNYSFEFFKDGVGVIESEGLKDFFENEVFNRVDFYEASDGYYIGEAGTVEITLNDDGENTCFDYFKLSESEYSESFIQTFDCDLTEEQTDFLINKVSSCNGGYDVSTFFEYKKDCILSNKEIEIRNELETILNDIADSYNFENAEGEMQDWYSWNINMSDIDDGSRNIPITVSRSFTIYKPNY